MSKPLLLILIVLILFGGFAGQMQGLSGENPVSGGSFFYSNELPALPAVAFKPRPLKDISFVRYLSTVNFLRHCGGGAILPAFGRGAASSQNPVSTTYAPTLLTLGCQLTA